MERWQRAVGVALVSWAAALMAGLAAGVGRAADYTAVQVGGEDRPALYLLFRGNELRMATSPESLEAAKPIKAKASHSLNGPAGLPVISYAFPELELPISVPGASAVKAEFRLWRVLQSKKQRAGSSDGSQTSVDALLVIETKAADGSRWTYEGVVGAPTSPRQPIAKRNILQIPLLEHVSLATEIQVKGKKVAIGLRAMLGENGREESGVALSNILKNGKPARAIIEITDAAGKVVHRQRGNLEKFGFT